MKNNSRKLIFGICAFLLATLSLGSCNSDDYLVDGGTSNPYFDGNVMQYLESRPDLFKDLVKVIKLTKWEDILTNEEVTFFAPTDFTIAKSVERMNYYLYNYQGMDKITELSQVKPAVWEDLIGMYVMEGKYRLNDIAQIDTAAVSAFPGQTNFTYDRSYKMTMGVCYGDASGIKYAGYRQVMYAYQDFGYPEYAYVSSCNIEPTNGHFYLVDSFCIFQKILQLFFKLRLLLLYCLRSCQKLFTCCITVSLRYRKCDHHQKKSRQQYNCPSLPVHPLNP